MQVSVHPDRTIPMRVRGRIERVPLDDSYTITLRGLSAAEVREVGDKLAGQSGFMSIEESANTAPGEAPLPQAFQRRIEID